MSAEKVAEILLEKKAISLKPNEPFRYVSGLLSPIYTDCRSLISFPDERKKITELFVEMIKENQGSVDVIAGTATAGIPWAAFVADKMNLPMIYIRSSAKEHGKGKQIEGELKEGQKVAIVEDLISTGGSSLNSVNSVRAAGGISENVFAIVTYELEKASRNFEKGKCSLHTLTKFSTLAKIAAEKNYVQKEDIEKILEWNKDPSGWGKKMGFE